MGVTTTTKITLQAERDSCPVCSKTFKRSGDLRRHIRIHDHPSKRPFQCTECQKTFVQRTALKTHMNVHSGLRPHMCNIGTCRAVFGDPSSASRHRRERHKDHSYFKCPTEGCKSQIKRRSSFKSHLRDKHHIVASESDIDSTIIVLAKEEDPSQETELIAFETPALSPLNSPECDITPMQVSPGLIQLPYFVNDSTPELSRPGSSASSSRSSSILSSPTSASAELAPSPYASPYVLNLDAAPEYHDLMLTSTSLHINLPKLDTTMSTQQIYSEQEYRAAWDSSSPLFSSSDELSGYSPDSELSPLSELSLPQLHSIDDQVHLIGALPNAASMQGLYYDTIPHTLSTAWLQS